MRDALYRGKDKTTGKWWYGYLVPHQHHCLNGKSIKVYDADEQHAWASEFEVNPETVGENTDLLDKNGVMIFEGDILECTRCLQDLERRKRKIKAETEKFRHVVYFDHGKFYALQEYLFDKFVIGNIHDNPELLNTECF